MKSNTFNYSLLAVGVAALMGVSTGAMASITSGPTTNSTTPAISNVANASYNVAGVTQTATSNIVTVNVSETANFILYATNGNSSTDDKNENIATTPNATATFNHILINEGNVSDTYNINTTANNDDNIETATPTQGYAHPANTDVAFVIRQKGGAALTTDQANALQALGQAQSGNLTGGANATTRNIKLLPGLQAALSYTSLTPTGRTGGDIAVGTLTATSSFITTATTTGTKVPTLVNENQTIVRLPTFSIVKTAASSLDLTATTPQIDYSITVTNANTAYSAVADNFVIRDVLPVGVTLTGNVTASGAAITSNRNDADGRQIIDVAVPSLAANANQVITFKVNVDKTKYTAPNSSITNNVAVYDKFTGTVGVLPISPVVDTNYDILDSTNNTIDYTRVPVAADQSGGAGVDTAATTTFTRRVVVLSNSTTREIAPASGTTGQVTHSTNITNNGQDTEGTDTNPLTFTIADGGLNPAVRPVIGSVSVTYTPPGGGAAVITTIQPTVANGNTYTLNTTTLPGGIAPGGVLAINYKVSSGNVTTPATVADAAAVGSTETTIVTLTPTGTGAPAVTTINDTTNVKGLTLLKQAAVQVNCTGTIPAYQGELGAPTTISDTAKPGDCIYYKITANNTFTPGTNLTNVVVSDATNQWTKNGKVQAVYQGDAAASGSTGTNTGLTGSGSTQAVSTTFATLAGGASGILTFSTKVNP